VDILRGELPKGLCDAGIVFKDVHISGACL